MPNYDPDNQPTDDVARQAMAEEQSENESDPKDSETGLLDDMNQHVRRPREAANAGREDSEAPGRGGIALPDITVNDDGSVPAPTVVALLKHVLGRLDHKHAGAPDSALPALPKIEVNADGSVPAPTVFALLQLVLGRLNHQNERMAKIESNRIDKDFLATSVRNQITGILDLISNGDQEPKDDDPTN